MTAQKPPLGAHRRKLRAAAPDLARLPMVFDLRAISLAEGVRAGLSIAVIVAASQWLHVPGMIEAALAALFTCLSDAGGPVRRRIPALVSMSALGAAVVIVFGLARAEGVWLALPLAVAGIFLCTFVRIYGQSAQQVGTMLCFVLVLSLDHAQPSIGAAVRVGGMFLTGGLWATALTLGIWQVHPFRPARKAIAGVYEALALLVRDLREVLRDPGAGPSAWDLHTRTHRHAVREAIEAARAVVLDTVKSHGPTSRRAALNVLRLEAADQLFGALIAFADQLEAVPATDRGSGGRLLRRLRPMLPILAEAVLDNREEGDPRLDRPLAALRVDVGRLAPGDPLRRPAEAIVERLQVACTLDSSGDIAVRHIIEEEELPWWRQVLEPLEANLNWNSLPLRHALRAAVAAAPALAFTLIWFNPYDHWLTITIVATMQPYFGATFTRALERAGGTLAGGLIATLLGLFVTMPLEIAAVMFPLAVIALAIRAVSFGLYMAALTPMVVLLVELGAPGAHGWTIAEARALLTVIGCLVAVASCYLLWPSWEPDRLAEVVRSAIGAHGRYARAVFANLLKEPGAPPVDPARRLAGLATNNAEASVSRALLEPGRAGADRMEAAMVIDAALRRMAGRLTAVQLSPRGAAEVSPEALRTWRDWIGQSLEMLAEGRAELAPRPESAGPLADTLGRIARQIELMAGSLGRLAA